MRYRTLAERIAEESARLLKTLQWDVWAAEHVETEAGARNCANGAAECARDLVRLHRLHV